MLLTESEKAKQLRTRILDIVIATINGRAGGGTKYINWRDRDYLPTAIKSENYRKNFNSSSGKYVDGIPTCFGLCTGHYFEDSYKWVDLTVGGGFVVHNDYY